MDPYTKTAAGRLLRLLAFAGLIAAPVAAQQAGPIQEAIRGKRVSEAPRIEGRRITATPIEDTVGAFMPLRNTSTRPSIYGTVQNHFGDLVPNAGEVLIRSLSDGSVVAHAQVDQFALFEVRAFDPGFYTAQLVDKTGKTLATTGAFTAALGEVVRLTPVIPSSPLTKVAAMFANSTSSVVDSAAAGGVLAVKAGEPVSPEKAKQ
jgi:hypothetical protein